MARRRRNPAPLAPAAAALLMLVMSCARPEPRAQPDREEQRDGVKAVYHYRTLTADLPATVRVPAVIAAAESVLTQRGYTVRSRLATEYEGRIEALPPLAGAWDAVWVGASLTPSGTRASVRIDPGGDAPASRAIMAEVLAALGL